jgi:hypothetical protein
MSRGKQHIHLGRAINVRTDKLMLGLGETMKSPSYDLKGLQVQL